MKKIIITIVIALAIAVPLSGCEQINNLFGGTQTAKEIAYGIKAIGVKAREIRMMIDDLNPSPDERVRFKQAFDAMKALSKTVAKTSITDPDSITRVIDEFPDAWEEVVTVVSDFYRARCTVSSCDPRVQVAYDKTIKLIAEVDDFYLHWLKPGTSNREMIEQYITAAVTVVKLLSVATGLPLGSVQTGPVAQSALQPLHSALVDR